MIHISFRISEFNGCKSNRIFNHGIYTTLKASPSAHNKAQINHLLLNRLSPYCERIICIFTNSQAAINKKTVLLAITKSTPYHLRNNHKDQILTDVESKTIFKTILLSIIHCEALRGLRSITLGLIGSIHKAIAGNQSVITFNHNR